MCVVIDRGGVLYIGYVDNELREVMWFLFLDESYRDKFNDEFL